MAKYIDREAAFDAITDLAGKAPTRSAYEAVWKSARVLKKIPAADVVPVVHAKWIHTKTEEDDWGHSFHHWHCPVCGWFEGSNPEGARKYCSGCGAKMGGVVDNT